MKVWIIDDEAYNAQAFSDIVREHDPEATVVRTDDLFHTREAVKGPDILIIDLSSIAPLMSGPAFFYGPLCSFHQRFPNTTIIISTAASDGFSKDVANDIIERCPDAIVKLLDWKGCDPYSSLKKILEELKGRGL